GAPAPELLPLEELADCAAVVLAREGKTILTYGAGAGYAPLRALIGEWFGVHPSRVVLTNGSLQALDLLAPSPRAQTVRADSPTYGRAYKVLLAAGVSIVTGTVDADGLDPANVEAVLAAERKPAFIYTIPTFQNPTGTSMTPARRQQLAAFAARREVMLVEDDPDRPAGLAREPQR